MRSERNGSIARSRCCFTRPCHVLPPDQCRCAHQGRRWKPAYVALAQKCTFLSRAHVHTNQTHGHPSSDSTTYTFSHRLLAIMYPNQHPSLPSSVTWPCPLLPTYNPTTPSSPLYPSLAAGAIPAGGDTTSAALPPAQPPHALYTDR